VELLEELQSKANVRSALAEEPGDLYIPVATQGAAALGRDLHAFAEILESDRERGLLCDAVVILLGTNDLRDDFELEGMPFRAWSLMDTPEERAAAIDGLMTALPEGLPVLWIVPDPPALPLERRMAMAASLEAAQQRWPQLSLMSAEPSWFEGSDADGTHFTREGELEVAGTIVESMSMLGRSRP
jgi:lysophospholipase L1-like esterase